VNYENCLVSSYGLLRFDWGAFFLRTFELLATGQGQVTTQGGIALIGVTLAVLCLRKARGRRNHAQTTCGDFEALTMPAACPQESHVGSECPGNIFSRKRETPAGRPQASFDSG
jgi:hypothetical protein